MQINYTQDETLKEVMVDVRYAENMAELEQVKKCLGTLDRKIAGSDNGRQYAISIYDIYYIESVDRKTFIYTKNQVFRSEWKLYMLLETLPDLDFVRINKSCILNINVLESISTLTNSRLEACLSNGEKVWVSRTYLADIRKMLEKGA